MRKRFLAVVMLSMALLLLGGSVASASSWYSGNERSRGYGVRADISTPATAPYVDFSGQSSWVSTPGDYWVQSGWRYYNGWAAAKSYYEYNLPSGYHLEDLSDQVWNFTRTYEVSYAGSNYWTVKINGTSKGSWGLLSAPVEPVQAHSESHYPTVELNTQFNNVKYRGETTWFNFNEAAWVHDSPYWVSVTSLYKYRSQGP